MAHDDRPVSYLFVPATARERIPKALACGADRVIVDLEDGVAPHDKDAARRALFEVEILEPTILRINACSSEFFEADMAAALALTWVDAVMIPKVERADDVAVVARRLPESMGVLALVESALGIVNVEEIAAAQPHRLVFGSADYLADIKAQPSAEVLAYPRSRLVVASSAFGLPAAVDGPSLALDGGETLRHEAAGARALGLGAKLCIHPAQVDVVNQIFRTSDAERAWAESVLEESAHHSGVFKFDGSMVDAPVLLRARQILGR